MERLDLVAEAIVLVRASPCREVARRCIWHPVAAWELGVTRFLIEHGTDMHVKDRNG